jgi:hypothetical protein
MLLLLLLYKGELVHIVTPFLPLQLHYIVPPAAGALTAPTQLIAKLVPPKAVVSDRARNRARGLVKNEAVFYQKLYELEQERAQNPDSSLLPKSPLAVLARPFFAAYEPLTDRCCLLIEDLSLRAGAYQRSQIDGCTLPEARATMRAMAGLHAFFWNER